MNILTLNMDQKKGATHKLWYEDWGQVNTMAQSKRPRRTFTPEFKHQLVQLYKSGKRKCDITKEYDVGYSTLDKWIKQEENSGSFKEKDNLTPEQLELIKL